MIYPMIASEQQNIMISPRDLILSDIKVPRITAKKPAIFGGTVKSWAFTLL